MDKSFGEERDGDKNSEKRVWGERINRESDFFRIWIYNANFLVYLCQRNLKQKKVYQFLL